MDKLFISIENMKIGDAISRLVDKRDVFIEMAEEMELENSVETSKLNGIINILCYLKDMNSHYQVVSIKRIHVSHNDFNYRFHLKIKSGNNAPFNIYMRRNNGYYEYMVCGKEGLTPENAGLAIPSCEFNKFSRVFNLMK